MIRRGFLAMLGLAPIASMIQEAPTVERDYNIVKTVIGSRPDEYHLKYLNQMKSALQNKEEWIQTKMERMRQDQFAMDLRHVDVDIRAMKSFSDVAKVRMMMRRVAERQYEQESFNIENELKNFLSRI
jgi:UDP-N-acetylglucosamine enolpyruvyl transferase